MVLGRRCGNKSGLMPRAMNGGLGLRCSVCTNHVSDHSKLRKARLTHLALEIDRGGASQVAFVVGLLHRRRGRLSQIHVGQMCVMSANTPICKAVGQLV
jgi:hypothetical protein